MLAIDTLAHDMLDCILDSVITISVRGQIEFINKSASTLFGYSAEEVMGQNVSMLMPEPHRSQHDGYLQHYQRSGEARTVGIFRELDGMHKDGHVFPMSLSVSKIEYAGNTAFMGVVRDLTKQREVEEQVHRLAFYDPLTHLANRRLLMDRLQHAMTTCARTGEYAAVMLLDIDHFKQVNDTLSHEMGDLLLQLAAQRIKSCIRNADTVARIGGDEFEVLLTPLSENAHEAAKQAEGVANKILQTLNEPYTLRGHIHRCTASIGIAMFMEGQESLKELVKKADVAMYQAKSTGRGRVCFFDPAIQATMLERNTLEGDLRRGLERREFVLHYQLQFDRSAEVVGAEALVRWNNTARGMVSPAEFIPLAEETGLVLPLGQWVLEAACAQLAVWAQSPATAHWTLAVNVSASQFSQASFVDNVLNALTLSGANPHRLKLELTESMLVNDVKDIIVKMNTIKALGVSFSLDDFGTGYSSLSYLKRLPIDQLKIDQSFVRDLLSDASSAVIARTVVALGHSLGLSVIAEGVETQAQCDFLDGVGCDAYQGYFFARPMASAALTDIAAQHQHASLV